MDIAVLFADVRGSTALGEQLGATGFAKLMNRFYSVATDALLAHDALIDKLIGDEVMALFVRGVAGPEYRRKACDAGLALLRGVGAVDGKEPWLPLGVAVHAGTAFVGNVGSSVVDFTALGDTVNTASRLQSVAEPGKLVLSQEAYASLAATPREDVAREVPVRGKADPMKVHVLTV